ncbi:MutS-related protein [Dyadobacter sp. Leaf189]|uniref:MutS-related protein n=1 Tax=Dyadobacter sp. Leaf189 TaxID=1736295 RepID=UPI0006F4C839|nr:DNA mismatch repair protein MutS [Dyadobacter sp. Leaf189]KQS32840.1 DNA mismatch repair protein MutS [Dyadobacter sp. Leaf189]
MENTTAQDPPAAFFEARLRDARVAEAAAQQKSNELSFARLAVFVTIILFVWLMIRSGEAVWALAIAVLVFAFLFLMRKHQQAKQTRDFHKNLQTVNEDERERLSLRFKRTDNGMQYTEKQHAFLSDLDIFGEYSLYKLLNRTRTSEGSKRLSNWLKNHATTADILARQQASADFKKHPELMQTWEATALLHEHAAAQVGAFRAWSTETLDPKLATLLKMRWFPVVTLLVIILAVSQIIPIWTVLACYGVHFYILKQFQAVIQITTNKTTTLGKTLVAYADLLKIAESAPYTSGWWMQRKALIQDSSQSLHRAGALFERLDYRNNPFFSLVVGIPSLWDVHCLAGLEKWKQANQSKMWHWLDVLADAEAMNSLAGHAFANPEYVVPEVTEHAAVSVRTTAMGHPLIPAEKRVSNDFELTGTGSTMLVTGSNMSGKSTFLRTIGLNLVLAQIGAVISATAFSCSPLRVFSSMRTQDSLEESTSSFYAELKRLRLLLELSGENAAPVFYLLDEILKGTNSADRHRGAEALIRQLHGKNASGLVSTHDLELGQWGETEGYVHNFHFRSDVEEGKLHFDYRLYKGICRSFNASELMRMMGIEIAVPDKNTAASE